MRWTRDTLDPLLRTARVGPLLRIRLAAEVLATYARVRWLMSRHDIVYVVTVLRAGIDARIESSTARRLATRLDRPVGRTLAVLPADSRCLIRSLVVLRMMARRGARCELALGARSGTQFQAHAWIEHDGEPVLPTLGYSPLTTI
jgi:hypothetical protein